MPHFVIEYSANLRDELNIDSLLSELHTTTMKTGIFPLGGVRFRAVRSDDYLIGDGDPRNAFVHMTLKIGHGRTSEVKKKAAEELFSTLTAFLQHIYDERPLAISFEMLELEPELNFKKNNIHDWIDRKSVA